MPAETRMQIPGLSLRRIPADRAAANVPVFRLDYHADPSMVGERLEKLRSAYTSDARWRREMEIEYSALEGELLYPEWNRGLNVCEPFDVATPNIGRFTMRATPTVGHHTRSFGRLSTSTATKWCAETFGAVGTFRANGSPSLNTHSCLSGLSLI